VNQGQLGNQDQLEEVTVTGSRSILDRLTNWLCEEGQEDLIKGAADSTANLGAASDIVRPAAAIVAGAAVSSRSLPSPQATSFLGSQAANALETVGILGKRVAQISILGDVANGNYQSALFDTADYFVYKGLGEAAAAGALETGGASVATAGLAALTYYNAGGAQGLIQGSLCGDWPETRMETLDKIFVLLFARCRRTLGQANLEYVWRRANIQFGSYISWALMATVFVLWVLAYSYTKFGSHSNHKAILQVVAVAVWLGASMALNMRFKKYLRDPPALASEETNDERRFLLRFRMASIGVFVITLVLAFFLGRNKFHFMAGFWPLESIQRSLALWMWSAF
jgi:hypothetical protein